MRRMIHKAKTNNPIVTFNPLEKYPLVNDVRIHNEYTPATVPVFTTLSVTTLDDENTETTLAKTLTGLVQTTDEKTNANESPLIFTSPAPDKDIV